MKFTLHVRDFDSDNPSIRTIERELSFKCGLSVDEDIIHFGAPYVEYHLNSLESHLRHHSKSEWLVVDMAGRNYGVSPFSVCARKDEVLSAIAKHRARRVLGA